MKNCSAASHYRNESCTSLFNGHDWWSLGFSSSRLRTARSVEPVRMIDLPDQCLDRVCSPLLLRKSIAHFSYRFPFVTTQFNHTFIFTRHGRFDRSINKWHAYERPTAMGLLPAWRVFVICSAAHQIYDHMMKMRFSSGLWETNIMFFTIFFLVVKLRDVVSVLNVSVSRRSRDFFWNVSVSSRSFN